MIKKALLGGLEAGLIAREELYTLDDQSLFALLAGRSHPLFTLADKVRKGCLFEMAAEFPYDEDLHRGLSDIKNRSRYEAALGEEFSEVLGIELLPEELIIDLPEPISFETGLYVSDENCYFAESSGVFNAETLKAFIKNLRVIRIFIDPVHKKGLKSYPGLQEILHLRKKWLHLI
jgi:hypothetical protein